MLATAHSEMELASGVTAQSSGMIPEVPLFSTSSITGAASILSAGPSALPPSIGAQFPVSGLSSSPAAYSTQATPTRPPTEYAPPSFPVEFSSPSQPSLPLSSSSYTASPTAAAAGSHGLASSALPPPPTMGFVPAHGIVTAHPSKVIAYVFFHEAQLLFYDNLLNAVTACR